MNEFSKFKDWAACIIAVIIFYGNIMFLAEKCFANKEHIMWHVGFLATDFILLPGLSKVSDRNHYVWATKASYYNPLYVKGYFRKFSQKSYFWSELKGLYYCQLIMAAIMIVIWGYIICFKEIPPVFYSNTGIITIGIMSWILFVVWLGFHVYYRWCYNEAFRYTQNEEEIWQPYSYIAKYHGWSKYQPFRNKYYIRYKRMRENLKMSCPVNEYQYVGSYEMGNHEDESDIYIKHMRNEIRIFQLIHVQEYTEDTMKQLNDIFSDFWKTYIGNNSRAGNASILFLLCVEEYSKELKKRLLSVCSVDQKKGRNRVAAVITYYGKPSLTILDSYGMVRGKKKYRELRAEMLALLGMSEKNNHKSYGDKEEYGKLKEISEEDLNAILDDIEDESWDL